MLNVNTIHNRNVRCIFQALRYLVRACAKSLLVAQNESLGKGCSKGDNYALERFEIMVTPPSSLYLSLSKVRWCIFDCCTCKCSLPVGDEKYDAEMSLCPQVLYSGGGGAVVRLFRHILPRNHHRKEKVQASPMQAPLHFYHV